MPDCPFCRLDSLDPICESPLAYAFRDAFPVSPGHTLIVPRRHVASFFDLTADEQSALLDLARRAREILQPDLRPAGWNLGLNDGAAAGQTVMHVHLHLIPRYEGDQADPRGGVRWIFPERARYWEDDR